MRRFFFSPGASIGLTDEPVAFPLPIIHGATVGISVSTVLSSFFFVFGSLSTSISALINGNFCFFSSPFRIINV